MYILRQRQIPEGNENKREADSGLSELGANHTLRQCVISMQVAKILAITSMDIVAAQAHYRALHACYKNYRKVK